MNSEFVENVLSDIKISIENDKFIDVEKSKVELKDLSTGNEWKSLKETICAYLNTDGGIVICGVRERDKKYKFTGFNRKNENNLIELQTKFFCDDHDKLIDLSQNIFFEFVSFLDGDVAIIIIYPLSDDKKFVRFDQKYFERKLTQDREIPSSSVQRQKEYKSEIEYAKELTLISNASLEDLSLDKINSYVTLLNREIKNETLKASIDLAKPFLNKQHFIKDSNVTTLGMLVCGEDPFHFLGSRVEVNCYYNTSTEIARDKKMFRSDVINLMEDTFRYIWGHIKVTRSVQGGGTSEPEYSEKLIRETINNALAHRDYTIDNFVTVTIEPNKYIEIKNPGSFKEKIKFVNDDGGIEVRRLIPGIPESKNPKLASVLKVFDKIESQGRGMASLVNAALENSIDLPTYEIKEDLITLRINTGKLVDESIETWLDGFKTYIVNKLKDELTFDHKAVLAYFYKSELANQKRLFSILLSESNNHFTVIKSLKDANLIFEHTSSTDNNPIYILNRILVKTDFKDEMIVYLGNDYIHYDKVAKEVLNLVYLFTKFNEKSLKAAEITPEIYRKIYGKEIIGRQYESLGRKVRSLCNNFERKNLFIKGERSDYWFNTNYKPESTLFEN